ncbi:hypothetical protein C8Q80DRAFT_631400 [Daedaleopsis nitida]|nr:hypothetical protein C8Q80DRAFT_631400 [Daedaleopsis nitida]
MSDLRSSGESTRRDRSDASKPPYLTIKEITEEEEPALSGEKSAADKSSFLNALLSPSVHEILQKPSKISIDSGRTASPAPSKKDGSSSGTAKLKPWFRKKLRFEIGETCSETKIVLPGDCSSRKSPLSSSCQREFSSDLLPVARQIVRIAGQDLSCIEGCMDEADQFLSLATNLLSQTERRLKMVILNRQAALESARLAQLEDNLDDPFMSAIASTIRSATHDAVPFPISHTRSGSDSEYSLGSVSAGSSVVSLPDTLIESEDDDVRALRRLLTRKVEARTDGALDEIDKVLTWLRIVQDTLRSIRRRTNASVTGTLLL